MRFFNQELQPLVCMAYLRMVHLLLPLEMHVCKVLSYMAGFPKACWEHILIAELVHSILCSGGTERNLLGAKQIKA